MTGDTVIPVEALDAAHTALDGMVAKVAEARDTRWHTADDVWLQVLSSVSEMSADEQQQSLALLLTVALQRLARR